MEESVLKALLEEGITAAKAGQKERARQCLMQVVKADKNNEQAWLWLSVGWGLYGLLSIVFGGLVLFASSLAPRMLEHPDLQAGLGEGQIL